MPDGSGMPSYPNPHPIKLSYGNLILKDIRLSCKQFFFSLSCTHVHSLCCIISLCLGGAFGPQRVSYFSRGNMVRAPGHRSSQQPFRSREYPWSGEKRICICLVVWNSSMLRSFFRARMLSRVRAAAAYL